MIANVASLALRTVGWQFEGAPPAVDKCVALMVPHTSNWDALLLVALTQSIGLEIKWMIKDEWLRGPFGGLLRRTGAIGVDRSGAHDMVAQMIGEFARRDRLVLGIPPEGTRGRADHWRSGFYRIALGAGVPVVPGFLDFAQKRGGFGAPIPMSGDVRADMDLIRAFYAARAPAAYAPDNFGPIRLRDEA